MSNDSAGWLQSGWIAVACLAVLLTFTLSHTLSHIRRLSWIPEATLAMLGGVLIARTFYYPVTGELVTFSPKLFFLLLLPPIIFKSGFDMNLEALFKNLTTIMVFANLGTVINILVVCGVMLIAAAIGASPKINMAESLVFGSVVSATDPVTTIAVFERFKVEENLYVIVAGVSVLDDAVSVIIFNLFSKYVAGNQLQIADIILAIVFFIVKLLGSMTIGWILGVLFTMYLRLNKVSFFPLPTESHSPPLLLWLSFFCFIFCSYAIADQIFLSGIISSLFAGIAVNRYLPYVLHDHLSAQNIVTSLREYIGLWGSIVESLLFFYMGASMFNDIPENGPDIAFFMCSNFAFLLGRVAQIYPLSYLLNYYGEENICASNIKMPWLSFVLSHKGVPLDISWQHMILLAGLRGPIAFASALLYPTDSRTVRSCVGLTVFLSTFIFGSMTPSALTFLRIPHFPEASAVSSPRNTSNEHIYSPARQVDRRPSTHGSLGEDVERGPSVQAKEEKERSLPRVQHYISRLISQADAMIVIYLSSPVEYDLVVDSLHGEVVENVLGHKSELLSTEL